MERESVPSFSHSKLTTYQQCPQKYKFRYIDEIPPSIRSIELHLGNTVHRALEKLYADAMQGQTHSCDEILAFYQQKWDGGYTPQMRIVRSGTTARTYLEYGSQMLLAYHQRFHPFTESTTMELEEKFLFPLSGGHEIRGIIDRLAKAGDGSLEIHDYKTSRRFPTPSQAGSDTQLALYELALRHRWPDIQRITLIWHYLAFDKDISIAKTFRQLETVKQNTLGLIKRIESTTIFPTQVTPLCDWCEYKEICPAMKKR
jgi:putative RecB family exonuclease